MGIAAFPLGICKFSSRFGRTGLSSTPAMLHLLGHWCWDTGVLNQEGAVRQPDLKHSVRSQLCQWDNACI